MAKKKRRKSGPPKQYPFKQGVAYDAEVRDAIRSISRELGVGVAGAFRAGALTLGNQIAGRATP